MGVDAVTRMTDRAIKLAERVNLKNRLAQFQIDGSTQTNLRQLKVLQGDGLDPIIARFYEYLRGFPDAQEILKGHDLERLRLSQKAHWMRLFRCEFDRHYVRSCLMIGLAHYHARIPPQLYIASYSFFQAELLRSVMKAHSHTEFEALSISIGKVIMMDMSVALNAYILDAMALKV